MNKTATGNVGGRPGRLAHFPAQFRAGDPAEPAAAVAATVPAVAEPVPAGRRRALALTAEGPRRNDLIAWAKTNRAVLATMRLLAPAGVGALLAENVGLTTEPLTSGTVGPAATAGLAAAGGIDAMVAFSDPIELRPGDATTRSLTRLALYWNIPVAANRSTADMLLAATATATVAPAAA